MFGFFAQRYLALWIDHIYPPSSHEEISKFVNLWEAIKDTQLINNVEDDIRWRWIENGEYTTKGNQGICGKREICELSNKEVQAQDKSRYYAKMISINFLWRQPEGIIRRSRGRSFYVSFSCSCGFLVFGGARAWVFLFPTFGSFVSCRSFLFMF